MTNEKLKRAIGYALSLVCFQEVGMGEDEELGFVRMIVSEIQGLCERETGIKLDSYPTEFLKANREILKEKLPFTLLDMIKTQ